MRERICGQIKQINGVQSVEAAENQIIISLASVTDGDAGALVPKILARVTDGGGAVRHLALREPSLDEVFLTLTGKGVRD